MMRLLALNGFAEEAAPHEYLPTAISQEMKNRASIGVVESLQIPNSLLDSRNPPPITSAPRITATPTTLQYMTASKSTASPDISRSNSFIEGPVQASLLGWLVPVQEQVLNHGGLNSMKPLLVNGRGHDLIHFREPFPDAPGRLRPVMKRGYSRILIEEYILLGRACCRVLVTDFGVLGERRGRVGVIEAGLPDEDLRMVT